VSSKTSIIKFVLAGTMAFLNYNVWYYLVPKLLGVLSEALHGSPEKLPYLILLVFGVCLSAFGIVLHRRQRLDQVTEFSEIRPILWLVLCFLLETAGAMIWVWVLLVWTK